MKRKLILPLMALSSILLLGSMTSCGKTNKTSIVSVSNTQHDGEGVPSPELGIDGDTYVDNLTGAVYKKENGTWVVIEKGDTTYIVTFNLNGGHFADGSTTYPDQVVREGRWAKAPELNPIKDHCDFIGWFAEGSKQEWNFVGTPIYGNVNLVAQYRVRDEDKITVTVDPNNGEATYTYDTFVGDQYYPSIPSKAGYSFAGWFIKSTNEKYNGYVTAALNGETLVAQYEKSKFNVIYQVEANNEVTITGIINIESVSLDIPNEINGRKVTKIAKNAFANRIYLETVYIPKNVKEIDPTAFINSYKLASINVDSTNTAYTSVNGILFTKDMTELVCYPTKAGTSYTVPSSVKKIGNYAFYYTRNMGISAITLNEGLVEIGDYAFTYNETIQSLTFPSTLKKIGKGAFMGSVSSSEDDSYISPQGIITNAGFNEGLEEIGEMAFANQYFKNTFTLPTTVKVLGDYAFANCNAIEKVVFPRALEVFGRNVFAGATGIKEYQIDSANSHFTVSNKMLFTKDMKKLVSCPSNIYDDIVIPEGVEEIGDFGFYMVDQVKHYTMPSTLKKIGEQAFAHTYGLNEFVIPNSVIEMGTNCFDLSGISSITIGTGLTEIPEEAFIETKLKSVTIPGNVKKIGNGAFSLCSQLSSLTLEEGVEEISSSAFSKCSLTTLSCPDSLKTLGNGAFLDNNIRELNVKKGLTSIGSDVFYSDSKSGTTIDFLSVDSANISFSAYANMLMSKDQKIVYFATNKAGVENNGTYAVTLPNNVEEIAPYAFAYCKNISSLTLSTSLKTIGNGAFLYSKLTSLDFPASLRTIGEGVFYMSYLSDVTFQEGLETIGESAFAYSDLKGVTLPNSVKKIGVTAFAKNMSMTNLVLGNGIEEIGDNAFTDTKISNEITIPASCVSIGKGVFSSSVSTYGQTITNITVDSNNPNYSSEDGFLLSKDKKTVYACAGGKTGTITIPSSVTTIAPYALSMAACKATAISVPTSLTTIGEAGFAYLTSVYSLTIPASVTYIGDFAFAYWTSTQTITFNVTQDYALINYSHYYVSNSNARVAYAG